MKIGLLGGTFDPPHNGHLQLATVAQAQLNLDRVHFLPVGTPTHKSRAITPLVQRVAMLTLAVGDNPNWVIDLIDAERPRPHYTSTLLPLMREVWGDSAEFHLLIGGDSLRDFHKWHQPDTILTHCRLAVLPRPNATVDWSALAHLPTLRSRTDLLTDVGPAISSTQIRQAGAASTSHQAIPSAVADYIAQHNLYTPI